MAEVTYEDTKVYWLPAVANKAAPTVAEIGAGTDLTPFVPVDGVARDSSQNKASQAMLGGAFVTERVGTWSFSATLTLMRHILAGDDDAWELFDRGTEGFLLISPFGAAVAGLRVEVIPAEAHQPIMQATAENAYQKFTVAFASTAEPDFDAVVAA
jgi:hypothetical protein